MEPSSSKMPTLSPPTFSGNAEDWKSFSTRFQWYRKAAGLTEISQERQISMLIYVLGEKAEDMLSVLKIDLEQENNFDKVFAKFNTYFNATHNKIHARAKFNKIKQEPEEHATEFITRVYSAAMLCHYPENIIDELIRDRLIVGVKDLKLSNDLQLDPNIELQTVVTKIRQTEEVMRQQSAIRSFKSNHIDEEQSESIDRMNYKSKNNTNYKYKVESDNNYNSSCGRCGKFPRHRFTQCPARNSFCMKCRHKGHWAVVCRNENKSETWRDDSCNNFKKYNRNMQEINTETSYSGRNDPWKINIKIKDQNVYFKIDSGADVSAIGEKHIKRLSDVVLKPTHSKLIAAGQGVLNVIGKFNTDLIANNKMIQTDIFVIKNLEEPLLGKPAIEALGLLTRMNTMNKSLTIQDYQDPIREFPKLFEGLGKLKGEYKIYLKRTSKPYSLNCSRRLAIPLYGPLKKELQLLKDQKVIFPVEKPTPYCAGIVVRPKEDGNIRLCVDYTELNKNICRSRYQLPSVEECLAQIGKANFFSKLDANKGYFQLPLEENSKLLTTFITPFGRYAFNRMPMGIKCASEVFQQRMHALVEGIEGVVCCQDDILITGKTMREHDERLNRVLRRMLVEGITLNKNKCAFRVQNCNFLGHIISKYGIKPCPKKVEAILAMPNPTDVTTVRSLLGMVNYHLKFIPNLANITKPIRDLLKKNNGEPLNKLMWTKECSDAFERIKKILISPCNLSLFDPNKKIRVTADASSYGLGACIEQFDADYGHWKPISYASRSLTPTETNYAQIEKEALALTWACEKFSIYLTGLPNFELRTDHLPLLKILGDKPIAELSPRLQRFRLRLTSFDYTIIHVAGKYLHTADVLSRAPVSKTSEDLIGEYELGLAIVAQFKALPMSDLLLDEVRRVQELDDVSYILKEYIRQGWPKKKNLDEDLLPFYSYRGELIVEDNLIMKGNRVFIPEQLRTNMLNRLHEGHLGVEKCRMRARECVWWPGISNAIRVLVTQCHICIEHRKNPAEPLILTEKPTYPWEVVAVDLFSAKRSEYMVVIDYFSRFPEVNMLHSTTSSAIITHIKNIFARYGVPRILRSDNGPQFNSTDFKNFANEWGFVHITSSPHAHWSNGLAEAGVKIVKNIILKSEDPIKGLMAYRSTPLENGYSPGHLLFGRRMRTNMPIIEKMLIPKCPDIISLRKKHNERQEKTKISYDKKHKVKEIPDFQPGMRVWDTILRKYATIINKRNEPRSYNLQTELGNIIRRNARHLIPAQLNKNFENQIKPEKDKNIKNENATNNHYVTNDYSFNFDIPAYEEHNDCTESEDAPIDDFSSQEEQEENDQYVNRNNSEFGSEFFTPSNTPRQPDYVTRSGRPVYAPKRFEF